VTSQASDSKLPANQPAESGLKSQPSSFSPSLSPLTPPPHFHSRPSLLVVGLDSMIGSALMQGAEARGIPCQGTSRRPGARWHLDLAAPLKSWQLPENATTAILCAARTRLADCETRPEETHTINVTATVALARLLNSQGTRIVFISTNQVFPPDLADAPDESSPVAPVTAYGRQKAEAEKAILGLSPKNAVIRLTKVISPDHGLLAEWKKMIANGYPIKAYSNLKISPIPLLTTSREILNIALSDREGIFHLGGSRALSYFDLAKQFFSSHSTSLFQATNAIKSSAPPALRSSKVNPILID